MNTFPEVQLAQHVSRRFGLTPSVDIYRLASRFAHVEEDAFPQSIKFDGVSLDIKRTGKTKIVLNTSGRDPRRIRFTLAHELGHVLIPWHTGLLVADYDTDPAAVGRSEWQMEVEANRFASELLAPASFIGQVVATSPNPLLAVRRVSSDCNVSYQVSAFGVISALPPGHIFVAIDQYERVIFSGRSPGTLAAAPARFETLEDLTLRYMSAVDRVAETHGLQYVWWRFETHADLPEVVGTDSWRDKLGGMVDRLNLTPPEATRFKNSINAVIANANGSIRKDRSPQAVYAACVQRLATIRPDRPLLAAVMAMPEFESFLSQRVQELAAKHREQNLAVKPRA